MFLSKNAGPIDVDVSWGW